MSQKVGFAKPSNLDAIVAPACPGKGCLMTKEKRRFTRVPFKMEAELKVVDTIYHVDEISDLSVGGCLLSLSDAVTVGAKCRLAINLGGPTSDLTIEMDGEIVRTPPAAVAVKFTGIEIDSLFHLQNVVRYNSSDPDAVEKELRKNFGIV